MSSKYRPTSRVFVGFALASLSLTSIAKAQPYGPGQGGFGHMMGGGWGMGWGMGGFGGLGVLLVICLLALGFILLAFRRQKL